MTICKQQLRTPLAVSVLVAMALVAWTLGARRGARMAAPMDPGAVPVGVDTTVTLLEVAGRLARCRDTVTGQTSNQIAPSDGDPPGPEEALADCAGAIYVWSREMPLSRTGIAEIAAAAEQLEIDLAVVPVSELYAFVTPSRAGADGNVPAPEPAVAAVAADAVGADERRRELASELIARGATIHFPAVIPYRGGELTSTAIVGYKTAATYQSMLRKRLAGTDASELREIVDIDSANGSRAETVSGVAAGYAVPGAFGTSRRDYRVPGQPGPYFRWVPGLNAIAFESGEVVYLLELHTGAISIGPGYIDFVPSPDGRFFVTPKRDRGGLEFYDAATVFREAQSGRGTAVEPIFVDAEMRDQYPSVGVLRVVYEESVQRTTYRVLTSWFDKIVFRDYEVTAPTGGGQLSVRPLGPPQPGCANLQVSLPIMAPDGRQLAGRDETSATTKMFRLDDNGRCTELVDLQMQTGKVAWAWDSKRIAFAIPRQPRSVMTDGAAASSGASALAGLFVFDPYEKLLTRVPGTERIQRLAFPEFVGDTAVMFLMNQEVQGDSSAFRYACCR